MSTLIEEMVASNTRRQAEEWQASGPKLADLLGRYLILWERATAPAQRREVAASIFADDGWYKDTMTDRLTPIELCEHIETVVLPTMQALQVQRYGSLLLHGGHAAFSWQFANVDGVAATFPGACGTDFVTLSEDRQIASLVGFFDAVLVDGSKV
jgi:hypothetical protein